MMSLAMSPPPPPPSLGPDGIESGVPGGVVGGVVLHEAPEAGPQKAEVPRDSKLIRKGEISLEVAEVARARDILLQRVKALGGWVADQGERRDGDGRITADLRLRIPSDRFEAGQQALRDLGTVKHMHLEVEDVSREWVDREARLQVKRTAAGRLRQILAQQSASLKDVLAAEQALIRLTEEIESLESIHRFQSRQVAYATLEVELAGPQPVVAGTSMGPLARFGDQLVTRLSASLAVLGLLAAALFPWALLALGIRFILRRRRAQAHLQEAGDGSAL
jgi:hypothetical protein